MVEVKGAPRLVASCHTPIVEGMVILTDSPPVMEARRAVVELLITAHTGPCVVDAKAGSCELHKLAAEMEIGQPRFRGKSRDPIRRKKPAHIFGVTCLSVYFAGAVSGPAERSRRRIFSPWPTGALTPK